ncbi:MAG: tRNA lysidine(34) synthetase TilS [Persicimonas sp.]
MDLLSKVTQRLEGAPTDDGILVALSGGLDSTVLFDLVCRYATRAACEVSAVHVDHRLRPSSSDDASFCRRLADRRGVPIAVHRIEVADRTSLQQDARVQRYAAIAGTALEWGCRLVLTAHHADDALETALINLRRGSASRGLASLLTAGAPPIPAWPDVALVRPLVDTGKESLRAYAESRELTWREDPTNDEIEYERNRLRQRVTPELTDGGRRLGPIVETLENLADEADALDQLADELLARARLDPPDGETRVLRAEPLADAPRAVAARALMTELARLPRGASAGRDHLHRAVDAIADGTRARLSVRGARLTVERGFVVLESARARGGRHLDERRAAPIEIDARARDGNLPWFGTALMWRRLEPGFEGDDASPLTMRVTAPADSRLLVRGPRDGDRLDAAGMQGRKAVGALLAEAGVPRPLRWRWPCVVREDRPDEPIWLCGLRRSSEISPGETTLELSWETGSRTPFGAILKW